jgi:formylglycine-generating enzyme required for sulfatase activity
MASKRVDARRGIRINAAALLAVTRKANATWVLPSEGEWYKVAHRKNNGVTADYFGYPTSSYSITTSMADCGWFVGHPTAVGSYGPSSPYGTCDQGGNV